MERHGGAASGLVVDLDKFDRNSGSWLERLVFNNRLIVIVIFSIITACLAVNATRVAFTTSYDGVIPTGHPFIQTYFAHRADLGSSGNTLRIVVEARGGNIYTKDYMSALRDINDRVFLLPGVDRSFMKSLWTPNMLWLSVTEAGLEGGPVMPDNFDGSQKSLDRLRTNVGRSGSIGQMVAADNHSSIILVPLQDIDQKTGKPLDYGQLSRALDDIRSDFATRGVRIHVVGFAMIMGDLIDALHRILIFFAASVVIIGAMIYWFTRCVRSTALVVLCSSVAVVWQIGLLPWLGFTLDPYSVLVPFLVFAIGMSHGAQKMNGVMQDIGRGAHPLVAARMTFRRLFIAGFTALVCDAVGFAVLLVINIHAIRQLAMVASIGVAVLILTNLILLPLLLSYVGVGRRAAQRSLEAEQSTASGFEKHPVWWFLDLFTQRKYALIALAGATALATIGLVVGSRLQTGDLNPGAPELRQSSQYNRDDGYLVAHYTTSSDVFVVMVTTPPQHCADYRTISAIGDLEQHLQELSGVEQTYSPADFIRQMSVGYNEGSLLWDAIIPNQSTIDENVSRAPRELVNSGCSLDTISIYLADHKATTLNRVVSLVTDFAKYHDTEDAQFRLAAGNSGIDAATNIVVRDANSTMLYYVYVAVVLLSLVTFRSWRAVLAAVLPLALTSILAQALMVFLGIGVKVATLPVTALGVGIGVDYALYVLSVTLAHLRMGYSLSEAYYRALLFTGKVVLLTGFALSVAVATWTFSPIKFQADMGILLAFMFLLNMAGALILLPSLACLLFRPMTRDVMPETSAPFDATVPGFATQIGRRH